MVFTKRHFNVKPNIAKETMKKSPVLKESSDVDMRVRRTGEISNLAQVKNVHRVYTASVVVSVNTVQAVKMQLIWSLCKHSIIMSQIVANWALFNFLLFSDGTS